MLFADIRNACFSTLLMLLGLSAAATLNGCELVGNIANAGSNTNVAPSYTGLKEQRVGIMVWANSAIAIDHPQVQSEVAHGLQEKLQQATNAGDDSVKKIQWVKADDILSFQESHPEVESSSAEEIATRLGVTRLIYVEIDTLSLHPNRSVDLTRGTIAADLKVIEVADGKGKAGWSEADVNVAYPPHVPPEGITGLEETDVYEKTVDAFTTELAKRFITHPGEEQHD